MFFAALVSSLALAIGLVLYDLITRELALSGVTAQSQYAIYAADTGAECALYWDNADPNNFATSSKSSAATASVVVNCAGQDVTLGPVPNACPAMPKGSTGCVGSTYATTTFLVSPINSASGGYGYNATTLSPCAYVEVGKYADANGVVYTDVLSHGYNTCTGATKLERELQVTY